MNMCVKVAIVDTGIDSKHEYLKENIIGGISFENKGNYIISSDEYLDENGHGTACASIVKNEFNNAKIFSVKIMDKNGKSNIQLLEEALRYISRTDIRIINLSLSVIDSGKVKDLYKICNILRNSNKIIICSLKNNSSQSYPAIFDNVIGVRGTNLETKDLFWYNKNYDIQCVIDNSVRFACYINNTYKLYGKSNSQAAAKLTGKIAKLISLNPNMGFNELQNKLESMAVKSSWDSNYIDMNNYIFNPKLYKYNKITSKLVKLLKNILLLKDEKILYNVCLLDERIGIDESNTLEIIKQIEDYFNINIDYMDISRHDLVSVHSLTRLIERYIIKI